MDKEKDAGKTGHGSAWVKRIRKAHRALKEFRKQAADAYDVYWVEKKNQRFPIFWSNVEIQHGAMLSSTPKPEVRRRHQDSSGPEKQLAQCIERAIEFQFDTSPMDVHLHSAVDDYLVAAAGEVRVHYDPEIERDEEGNPLAITNQSLSLEHIPYSRLTWEPNKTWEAVDWVAIEHMLSATEFKAQFPGKPLPESAVEGDQDDSDAGDGQYSATPSAAKYTPLYRIWEVWHKPRRRVVIVAEGQDEPIEVREDKLGLRNFFPFPRPMFMNLKRDELIPKPDFMFIESQLKYINRLTKRIDALTDAIRDIGFYDEHFGELAMLEHAEDGTLIPLKGLAERLAQAGGGDLMRSLITKLPIDQMGAVLNHLREMREDAKQQVYEITGISDIVRGATNPTETATAQAEKAKWAGQRFGRKKAEVDRFCRDLIRIMGEIISEHFEPHVLQRMTGVELTPEMIEILRDDINRSFAIDIETDSTVAGDEQEEQEQRLNMVKTVSEFLPQALELVQSQPAAGPLALQMLLFVVRSFKHGRQLEEEIEQLAQNIDSVGQLQQQLEELQQTVEQGKQELEEAQKQLAEVDQAEQQIEAQEAQNDTVEAQATANLKSAQADKIRQETAQSNVFPMGGMPV